MKKKNMLFMVLLVMFLLVACAKSNNNLSSSPTASAVNPTQDVPDPTGNLPEAKSENGSESAPEPGPENKATPMGLPKYTVMIPELKEVYDDEGYLESKQSVQSLWDDFYFIQEDCDASSEFYCYDYDNNLLYSYGVDYGNCSWYSWNFKREGTDINSIFISLVYLSPLRLTIESSSAEYGLLCNVKVPLEGDEFKIKYLDDLDPNKFWDAVCDLKMTFSAIYGDYIELTCSYMDSSYVWKYYNVKENKFYEPGTVELPAKAYPTPSKYAVSSFDASLWRSMNLSGVDGIFIAEKADKSAWCYLDKDGNILAEFKNATSFVNSSYALVSNDRETYFFMDKNMNVYTECPFEGSDACTTTPENKGFVVAKNDGSRYAIRLLEH